MVVMILAGPGQATGYPNYSYPWKWNHYHKQEIERAQQQKEQKKARPMVLGNNEDPEALFRKLDDMERKSDRDRMTDKILNPDFEKSSGQMSGLQVGPKLSPAQLYRENFSHYGSDSDHGEMELDDTFASISHNSFNSRPGNALKAFDSTDQEVQRILEYSRDVNVETKPSMAKASLLAKVVSSKGDPPIKRQPTINFLCNQKTTIPTRPTTTKKPTTRPTTTTKTTRTPFTTFCVPDPTTSTTSRPPAPPPPPPSPKPAPKAKCGNSRTKPRKLNASTAKMMLETILETKQHALAVLKNLNYMEMEILSQSPESCTKPKPKCDSRQRGRVMSTKYGGKTDAPKKPPATFSQSGASREFPGFSFGIRPISAGENPTSLALAREEELKLEERVWDEHLSLMRARRPWKPKRARVEAAPPQAVHLEPLPNQQALPDEFDLEEPEEKSNPVALRVIPMMPLAAEVPERSQPPQDPHGNGRAKINVQTLSVIVKPVAPAQPSDESFPPVSDPWGSPAVPSDPWVSPAGSQVEVQSPLRNEWEPRKHRKKKRRRKKKKNRVYEKQNLGNYEEPPLSGFLY
ncbi:hypothetical protein KR067_010425 [Drosophila pandora]|nr:hypothetical protein KR067_010425 [Drosophila pandora]